MPPGGHDAEDEHRQHRRPVFDRRGLKSVYGPFNRCIESLVRYERIYFTVMGIVHGLTNLGGSLLTAMIHSKPYDKQSDPATTAVSYGTFALFQAHHAGACPSALLPLPHPPRHLYMAVASACSWLPNSFAL